MKGQTKKSEELRISLIKAIRAGDSKEALLDIIDQGADLHSSCNKFSTVMTAAVYKADISIIQLLVEHGALATGMDVSTALLESNTDVIDALIGYVVVRPRDWKTAFATAMYEDNLDAAIRTLNYAQQYEENFSELLQNIFLEILPYKTIRLQFLELLVDAGVNLNGLTAKLPKPTVVNLAISEEEEGEYIDALMQTERYMTHHNLFVVMLNRIQDFYTVEEQWSAIALLIKGKASIRSLDKFIIEVIATDVEDHVKILLIEYAMYDSRFEEAISNFLTQAQNDEVRQHLLDLVSAAREELTNHRLLLETTFLSAAEDAGLPALPQDIVSSIVDNISIGALISLINSKTASGTNAASIEVLPLQQQSASGSQGESHTSTSGQQEKNDDSAVISNNKVTDNSLNNDNLNISNGQYYITLSNGRTLTTEDDVKTDSVISSEHLLSWVYKMPVWIQVHIMQNSAIVMLLEELKSQEALLSYGAQYKSLYCEASIVNGVDYEAEYYSSGEERAVASCGAYCGLSGF